MTGFLIYVLFKVTQLVSAMDPYLIVGLLNPKAPILYNNALVYGFCCYQ